MGKERRRRLQANLGTPIYPMASQCSRVKGGKQQSTRNDYTCIAIGGGAPGRMIAMVVTTVSLLGSGS